MMELLSISVSLVSVFAQTGMELLSISVSLVSVFGALMALIAGVLSYIYRTLPLIKDKDETSVTTTEPVIKITINKDKLDKEQLDALIKILKDLKNQGDGISGSTSGPTGNTH